MAVLTPIRTIEARDPARFKLMKSLDSFGICLLNGFLLVARRYPAGSVRGLLALRARDGKIAGGAPRKTFAQAAWKIVIADVSMSLDNVLAVAGAAREHPGVLVFDLILSIALMGLAATFIARLLQRHRWIAYVELATSYSVAGNDLSWNARGPSTSGHVSTVPRAAATSLLQNPFPKRVDAPTWFVSPKQENTE
jgi:Integral membrane protein TerC family